jgi:hypothetical protein
MVLYLTADPELAKEKRAGDRMLFKHMDAQTILGEVRDCLQGG